MWANGSYPRWLNVFITSHWADDEQKQNPIEYRWEAKLQIDSTGYTWQELAKIEFAFEKCPGRCWKENEEEVMFNGLMSVVDVLAEIHNIDLSVREEAKLMFVK